MPRNGSGIYSTPPGTDGVPNTTIDSARYNNNVHDVETDLNTPRPVVAGGTGTNNATDARFNLAAEAAAQVVTNYDAQLWTPGSFQSAAGAAGAPNPTSTFAGVCYIGEALANPPTNQNVVIEARDMTGPLGLLYVRQKTAGVWSPWVGQGVRVVRTRIYVSSGTYTPDPNMVFIEIMALGAGGGGGGCAASPNPGSQPGGGGGGGAGQKVVKFSTAKEVADSMSTTGGPLIISIGAGGTGGAAGNNPGLAGGVTDMPNFCTAVGGNGGDYPALGGGAIGGFGGTGGVGDLLSVGAPGGTSVGMTGVTGSDALVPVSGAGASTEWGAGGRGQIVNSGVAGGENGLGRGSGGSGGARHLNTTSVNGGAGTSGLVIIKEYCTS